jgi:SP family myo-inositol transporter-like MFS transporter 13
VLVVGLILYLASFSPGLNPVPWAVNAELYPLAIRGACSGLATAANWTANLAVSLTFLSLANVIGRAQTFWLLGG